jgi:hypothetical protein
MVENVNNISFLPYSRNSLLDVFLKFKPSFPDRPTTAIAIALLVVFVPLLIIPSQTLAEEEYRFERMWPVHQQPWFFAFPGGIATDKNGNVFIADTGNHRIQKLTSDGQLVTKWGSQGSGAGEFDSPEGKKTDHFFGLYMDKGGDAFAETINAFKEAVAAEDLDLQTLRSQDPGQLREEYERIRKKMGINAGQRQQDALDFIAYLAKNAS